MLKLQKHHGIVLILVVFFVIAWAIWTFVALPRSETPNLPTAVPPPASTP